MDSTELIDRYLRRAVAINRVSEYESARVTNQLRRLNLGIEAVIEQEGANLTQAKVERIKRQIDTAVTRIYDKEILPEVDSLISQIGTRESAWNISSFKQVGEEGIEVISPNIERIVNNAKGKLYQGRTFGQWYGDAAHAQAFRLNAALTSAWVEGMAVDELMDLVKKILIKSQNDIRTLTRSYLQHVAIEARDEVLKENDDVYDSVIWTSTLDHRTTPLICGIRDLAEYDKDRNPVGHDMPWEEGPGRIHFNCRSIHIPKIKGVDFTGFRPSVGAGENYESGDDKNTRGRVARPNKDKREDGTFTIKRVNVNTRYETWLRTQPTDFIADVLNNKDNAEAFKRGSSLKTFLPASGPGSMGSLTNQTIDKL